MNTLEQRCLNYMKAYKAPREEFFQHLWDSVVCPKDLAKKVLEHAGCNFDKIWTLNACLSYNPLLDKEVLTIDWLTVACYLKEKQLITLRNTAEAKDRVKQYLESIQ